MWIISFHLYKIAYLSKLKANLHQEEPLHTDHFLSDLLGELSSI
jgi:hypothetical protein